jgi:hypothetical protein
MLCGGHGSIISDEIVVFVQPDLALTLARQLLRADQQQAMALSCRALVRRKVPLAFGPNKGAAEAKIYHCIRMLQMMNFYSIAEPVPGVILGYMRKGLPVHLRRWQTEH